MPVVARDVRQWRTLAPSNATIMSGKVSATQETDDA
jgi:hypothetical protein